MNSSSASSSDNTEVIPSSLFYFILKFHLFVDSLYLSLSLTLHLPLSSLLH